MMAPGAGALGIRLRVLVESPAAAAAATTVDAPVGAAADPAAIRALVRPGRGDLAGPAGAEWAGAERAGAEWAGEGRSAGVPGPDATVLTFEHEHVSSDVIAAVEASGIPVRPGPGALRYAQDKVAMRTRLTELGVPCPRWLALPPEPAAARAALDGFVAEVGGPVVVKTARGGYDGRGVRIAAGSADVDPAWFDAAAAGGPALLAEERIEFRRELAALVARRPSGEFRAWPVVESIQRGGVCAEVIAPAPGLAPEVAEQAQEVARRIAEELDVTGVLAVELFEVDAGRGAGDGARGAGGPTGGPAGAAGGARVLVNELAMRPHNSGHWTIEGAVTSQFEQHLRAVLDLPLGDTRPVAPWTVMVNVLGSTHPDLTDALPIALAAAPDARVMLYGKEVRPGRKLGHVNVSGDELDVARRDAARVAAILRGERSVP